MHTRRFGLKSWDSHSVVYLEQTPLVLSWMYSEHCLYVLAWQSCLVKYGAADYGFVRLRRLAGVYNGTMTCRNHRLVPSRQTSYVPLNPSSSCHRQEGTIDNCSFQDLPCTANFHNQAYRKRAYMGVIGELLGVHHRTCIHQARS